MHSSNSRATTRRCARRPSTSAYAVALLLAALILAVLAPQAAQAGCITRLPVKVSRPDGPYAAGYAKEMKLRVDPGARRIRNLRAELYTFGGARMGASRPRRTVRGATTLRLRLAHLFAPLQVGAFTLVLTGEPNASRSCGPKQSTSVLRFRACRAKLPVTFPKLPGGIASDYGEFLSLPVRSTNGTLIRDVRSAVFGFDGSLTGTAPKLASLFGEQMLDHELTRPLTPGQYTVVVEGRPADQPAACGSATAKAVMTFQ